MGGATSPSTKLVKTPPPAPLYPGLSQQYQGMLQTMGPDVGRTLGETMKTGLPTNVGPAFEAMKAARERGTAQGRANVVESYGAAGLRYGSPLAQGLADYELQSQKDFAQIMADYTRQAQESAAGRRVQAAGLGAGLYSEAATTTYPTAALASGPSPATQATQAGTGALAMLFALGVI